MLTVEKVTTRDPFAALKREWDHLLQHSASNTIALTHEWLFTWWDVFHAGRELCLVLVRDGGQLVGIAPLLKRRVRSYGVLSLRRIEFLASGEDEFDEICSNYLDFIILKGREPEVTETILRFLVETEKDWDEIRLTDMAGESLSLSLLQAGAARWGLDWQTTREEMCLYVPLSTEQALICGLKGTYGRNLPKSLRAVARAPERVTVQRIETESEFEAGFEILVRLHQNRWISQGQPGSFASEKFGRFHRQLAPLLLRRGWLQLWVLWVDGEAVCAIYDFVYAGKVFYYQSGLGQQTDLIRSPGLYLRYAGLKTAICEGYTECDFLKGEPNSYKFNWGTQMRPIVQVRLARPGAKERLYQGANRTVEGLRPIKRRLQST
jgi:CelD/BcsL family acetyltransferase involved in cellulose biosynthesis